MGRMITVTGGARSGKSALAEKLASEAGGDVLYIATARAFDDEMRDRIAHHRASRPAEWRTYEGCYDIARQIREHGGTTLLDCMTIFVTNRMMDECEDWDTAPLSLAEKLESQLHAEIDEWRAAVGDGTLIVVTNELGMGLVPVYRFSRIFRDVAGRLNQHLARVSDEVYFTVSGIPMRLK